MALKPVIKAKAKTEPDQTCLFVVVGEKSENQSISRIIIIAYLMREREKKKKNTRHHKVMMMTMMKKDKRL